MFSNIYHPAFYSVKSVLCGVFSPSLHSSYSLLVLHSYPSPIFFRVYLQTICFFFQKRLVDCQLLSFSITSISPSNNVSQHVFSIFPNIFFLKHYFPSNVYFSCHGFPSLQSVFPLFFIIPRATHEYFDCITYYYFCDGSYIIPLLRIFHYIYSAYCCL